LALARKQRLEAVVHIGQDRRAGTEIGGDRQDAVRVLREIGIARPDIGADIGAAEAIDRLLGITDEEERARTDREGAPVCARDPGRRLAAEAPEDFRLKRVCVLKLGMWFRDALVGTAIYALPPRETSVRYGGETWELARLWISDDVPCNAETWLIAQSIRYIAACFPVVKCLVSYADIGAGHEGVIYKASNWTPDGYTNEGRKTPRCDYEHDGKIYARKSHVPDGIVPNHIVRTVKNRFYYELSRHRKSIDTKGLS